MEKLGLYYTYTAISNVCKKIYPKIDNHLIKIIITLSQTWQNLGIFSESI
jgi:hypothetical protein